MLQRTSEILEALLRSTARPARMVRRHVDEQTLEVSDVAPQACDRPRLLAAHEVSVRTSPATTMARSTTATTMNSE